MGFSCKAQKFVGAGGAWVAKGGQMRAGWDIEEGKGRIAAVAVKSHLSLQASS